MLITICLLTTNNKSRHLVDYFIINILFFSFFNGSSIVVVEILGDSITLSSLFKIDPVIL